MKNPTRLFDIPHFQLTNFPLESCLVTKENGIWNATSTEEFIEMANQVSRGLIKLGIKPNDKIAIISSSNRTEWNVLDLGILQLGCQNVPIYPTLLEKEYEYILHHSESVYCFVSCQEIFAKVENFKGRIPHLKEIYSFDSVKNCRSWEEVLRLGEDTSNQPEIDFRKSIVRPNDLATIIYTSGTTGTPKGVMLSHNNILSNIIALSGRVPSEPTKTIALSFLPLCHIYERMMTYMYQYKGVGIYYAESLENIGENAREIKPHLMTAVPRVIEKVYDRILFGGNQLTGIKKKLFHWAVSLGLRYNPYNENGWFYRVQLTIAEALIFKHWKKALGGNIQAISSGGAAIHPKLVRIFNAAGIRLYEGYGLTETSPVIAVNEYPNRGMKIGTVGKVLNGLDVKIENDGEVLVKGSSIMVGYFKEPERTKDVFKNGYFCTGDIGEIDGQGFLKITDRKKEIFKTSGGKYVAPQLLESKLKQSKYIEQAMVLGEGEKMPTALIQINFDTVRHWLKSQGIHVTDNSSLVTHEQVIVLIQEEIETANSEFAQWEKIKKFRLTDKEWSISGGELTPKLSLKRKYIKDKYMDLYREIYEGN